MKLKMIALPALVLSVFAQPVLAQDATTEEAGVSFDVEVTGVTDYRFRGVSLSGNDAALQASLTASTDSGFYGSVWTTNIADYGGAKAEIDVTAGWSGAVGPLTADVNVVGYLYPDGQRVNYYEFAGSLSKEFGPVSTSVGLAYSPRQDNIGSTDNTYLHAEASYAVADTPFTLTSHVGYEDGIFAGKVDYALGANIDVAPFTLGVSYIMVDADAADHLGKLAKNTALLSLTARF